MRDFLDLAGADVGAGVDAMAMLQDLADDLRAGGVRQRRQLAQGLARIGRGAGQDHADKNRCFLANGQFGSFQFSQRGSLLSIVR